MPENMVARLGGDEFVVLVDNLSDAKTPISVAEQVTACLSTPVTLGDRDIQVGASIGIAVATSRYDLPDDLVREADIATYRAKANGKGRYELFDSGAESQWEEPQAATTTASDGDHSGLPYLGLQWYN